MEQKIIKLLSDLSSFNILTARTVGLISDAFNVDADQLCTDNGITYFIHMS